MDDLVNDPLAGVENSTPEIVAEDPQPEAAPEEPKEDAKAQVYVWMNPRVGVLVVVARSEKQARQLAIGQDPIYRQWFLSVRPHVLPKAQAVGCFKTGGGVVRG